MTVVMAAIAVQFSDQLPTAFAVVVLAGVFQVLIGLLGIGRYIKLAPQPVVSGFIVITSYSIHYTKLYDMWYRSGPSTKPMRKPGSE